MTQSPALPPAARAAVRVAYLNTEYPSLSHTFIEREVRSVRDHGVEIRTYSIRRPGRVGTLGAAHRDAARETAYVLDGLWGILIAILVAAIRRPIGIARVIAAGQRMSPAGLSWRLRHAAYSVEAVRLAHKRVQSDY